MKSAITMGLATMAVFGSTAFAEGTAPAAGKTEAPKTEVVGQQVASAHAAKSKKHGFKKGQSQEKEAAKTGM